MGSSVVVNSHIRHKRSATVSHTCTISFKNKLVLVYIQRDAELIYVTGWLVCNNFQNKMEHRAVEFCLRFEGSCPFVKPAAGYTVANIGEVVVSGLSLVQAIRLGVKCVPDIAKQVSARPRAGPRQRVEGYVAALLLWLPFQLCLVTSVRLVIYSYKLYADIPCFAGRRWIAFLQCFDLSLFLGLVATSYVKRLLRVCFQKGALSTEGLYYKTICSQAIVTTVVGFLVAGFLYGNVSMSSASFVFMGASLCTALRDGGLFLIAGLKLAETTQTQSIDSASALARLKFLSLFTPCYIFSLITMAIIFLSVKTLRDDYGHCFFITNVFLVSVFTLDIIMADHKRINMRQMIRVRHLALSASPGGTPHASGKNNSPQNSRIHTHGASPAQSAREYAYLESPRKFGTGKAKALRLGSAKIESLDSPRGVNADKATEQSVESTRIEQLDIINSPKVLQVQKEESSMVVMEMV